MSEDYGVFLDGVNLASERIDVTDVDMEDVSLAVQFGDPSVTCRHCGSELTEYPGGDWQADGGWRSGSFCWDRWSDADTGEDDEPSDEATRAQYGHEPASMDSPTVWANGAGVIVTADSVQVWVSVGEPRGAFQMTVRQGEWEGKRCTLIHTPYPGMPEGHEPLAMISEGTMRVTDDNSGRNLSPLGRIRALTPSIVDIRTYADGFGRWHCEIDQRNGDHAAAGSAAWQALSGEIAQRGRGDRLQGLTFDHADSRDGILTSYFVEGPEIDRGEIYAQGYAAGRAKGDRPAEDTTEPVSFAYAGTVSHGTMQAQDLIPSFLSVVRELDPSYRVSTEPDSNGVSFLDVLAAIPPNGEPVWTDEQTEAADDFVSALFDTLDALAPDGFYFGAIEGDGSDYGFWAVSDESV